MIRLPPPTPDQQRVAARLADFIAERRERILAEWEDAVRRDETIPISDELTRGQLRDHIPQIIAGLSQMLCQAFNQELIQDTSYEAAIHAHLRFKEHADVSQLLREIAHLRATLIYHMAAFQEHTEGSSGALGLFGMVVVHAYLDRIMRVSVEQFLASAEHSKPAE